MQFHASFTEYLWTVLSGLISIPSQSSGYIKTFKNTKLVQLKKNLYEIHLTSNIILVYLNTMNIFSETRINHFQLSFLAESIFLISFIPEKLSSQVLPIYIKG